MSDVAALTLTKKEVKALMTHLQRARDDPAEIDETIKFVRAKQVVCAHAERQESQ